MLIQLVSYEGGPPALPAGISPSCGPLLLLRFSRCLPKPAQRIQSLPQFPDANLWHSDIPPRLHRPCLAQLGNWPNTDASNTPSGRSPGCDVDDALLARGRLTSDEAIRYGGAQPHNMGR